MSATILVTGGTGTVGRELVRRFAAEPSSVVVLSRAAAQPPNVASHDDQRRFDNVRFMQTDIRSGADLGLPRADVEALQREVTDIVHCAAATRFTLPLDEAHDANVRATQAVLNFADGCRALQRVASFSTVFVSGRRVGTFGEDDQGSNGTGFVNSYEQSKSEAEEVVRDAMARLPVVLFRLSTIVGDARTGTVHAFNAVHHAMRLLYEGLAPMIPGQPSYQVDLIGEDFAADAVHWLFRNAFEPGRTYHVCAGGKGAARLDDLIASAITTFDQHQPQRRQKRLQPPVFVDLKTYELFVRSVDEADNEILKRATRSIQSFVYQLEYPKVFDAKHAVSALAGSGLKQTAVLDFFPNVLRYCIDSDWGSRPR